jgi:putative oxidoreductase
MNLVGRVLFALPMAVFGLFHFTNGQAMAGVVPSYIPGGIIWVYITGIALIAAAVSIIIEKMTKLSGLLLGIMLAIFALAIHLPGGEASMPSLLKDLALAGAAFYISANGKN